MARAPRPPKHRKQLDPLLLTFPAGTLLFRVHPEHVDAAAFNPGIGNGGRFHFIRSAAGVAVPALYGAENPQAALAETVFHEVPTRESRLGLLRGLLTGDRDVLVESQRGVRYKSKIVGRVISQLRTGRDLLLVQLHDLGLKRLQLEATEITDTGPGAYERTREWAQALYDAAPCDGLVWMSRLFNSQKAVTLFGDRVSATDLEVVTAPLALWEGPGLALVHEIAEAAEITIFRS